MVVPGGSPRYRDPPGRAIALYDKDLQNLGAITKPHDKILDCAKAILVIFGHGYSQNKPAQTWKDFWAKVVNSKALVKTQGLLDQSANDVNLVGSILS